MAKAVCAQLTEDLIKLTPQLDDYLCPICLTIAFRPIRMKCRHVLCIRCTVLLQRQNKGSCPICREDVIMLANTGDFYSTSLYKRRLTNLDNIDKKLQTFQKQHFPEETRQKRIDIETADGIEQFGVLYKHPSESKCAIM
jgi:E3 ubiquitin-protein ligase BAH